MVAVASPHAQHEHDNEHGVQLEYHVRAHGPPQSPAETFAEAVELRDVIGITLLCFWVRAQACCHRRWCGGRRHPWSPPSRPPSSDHAAEGAFRKGSVTTV